ncbi:hypothetical protein [Coleofasciculus sp. FACHB-542]|nr:hypothetical protein [Coleofasciculus sp. FACHB-542]
MRKTDDRSLDSGVPSLTRADSKNGGKSHLGAIRSPKDNSLF